MSGPERTVMFELPSVISGTLACVAGTAAGRSWELSAGTFVVGRQDGCDLHLPAEPGVSKVHCKIVAEGENYMLIDCESRNGTIVNGSPVQRSRLRDGDEVRICGCVLRFTQRNDSGRVRIKNRDMTTEEPDSPPVDASFPPQVPASMSSSGAGGTITAGSPSESRSVSPSMIESTAPSPTAASSAMIDAGAPVGQLRPISKGRVLGIWYGAGLAGSLLFGGTASAVLVFTDEPRIESIAGAIEPVDGSQASAGTDPKANTDAANTAGANANAASDGKAADGKLADASAIAGAKVGQGTAGDADANAAAGAGGAGAGGDGAGAAGAGAAGAGAGAAGAAANGADAAKIVDASAGGANAGAATDGTGAGNAGAGGAGAGSAGAGGGDDAKAGDAAAGAGPGLASEPVERKRSGGGRAKARVPDEGGSGSGGSGSGDDSGGGGGTFSAVADGGKSETLKTRGGKVKSVEAKDGEDVQRGQVLVTFEAGGNANDDEMATLRDRISALQGAEEEDAKRQLKEAKEKLAALESSSKAATPVVASMSGKLTGFSVGVGEVLKSGHVVGKIVDGDVPKRVRVTVDKSVKPKVGQKVTLILSKGGEGEGTVVSVSGKKVIVQTEIAADEVAQVRF